MRVDKSKCLICEVSCHQKGLSFFKFPEEESRLKMWIKQISPLLDILKIEPNNLKENGRICARHFREKDFTNRRQNSLVRNAYPSLRVSNLSVNFHNEEIFTEEKFLEADDGNEKDIFQCGRCKNQFEILSDFMDHKRYQCQSGIAKSVRSKPNGTKHTEPNGLLHLRNVFINSFGNQIEASESGSKSSQGVVKIINEEPSGGRIVSFVINNDKLVVDEPGDFSALPNQELSTPCYNGVVKSGDNNPADLSLPDGVIVFPQTPSSVLLNDMSGETADGSFIITTNEGMVYACPIQNNNGVVISPASATNQVILTAEMADSAKGVDADDRVIYCELTNASPATPLLSKGEKVRVQETNQTEEPDKMKTRLTCSYCKKEFKKTFNLQQHERIHTGERPFQCIICGRAFKQKSNVRKHMLRHRVWPKARQTLNLRTQNKEGNGEAVGEIDYSCQYCPLSFKSYPEHKKHLAVHSDMKVYRCIQKGCNETFVDLDEFLFHSKMHSSAEFLCHICLKAFTSLEELGVHQYDHNTTEKEKRKESDIFSKLRCKICHARFKSTEAFNNHLAVDTHRYECSLCKRVFCTERFLRRHLLNHRSPLHPRFKCQDCKKTFHSNQNLRNHAFVHLKEKPYTCDHCDKQFGFKSRLKRHLAIHLNRYLECPFKNHLGCDKTFYRKDKLRDHLSTHTHCKLRSCRLCLKPCRTLPKLHHHLKRDHSLVAKNTFKCFACSQSFRKHKQLVEHDCPSGTETGAIKGEKEEEGPEAVSNIEIIMVPFGTTGRVIP